MEGLLQTLPMYIKYLFLFYLLCKAVDFISGILKTWKNQGTYKSRIMRDGIVRWIAELLAITFVIALDIILGLNFILIYPTLGLFIYKECGSIKENLEACGVELPAIIPSSYEKFNPNESKNNEEVN